MSNTCSPIFFVWSPCPLGVLLSCSSPVGDVLWVVWWLSVARLVGLWCGWFGEMNLLESRKTKYRKNSNKPNKIKNINEEKMVIEILIEILDLNKNNNYIS